MRYEAPETTDDQIEAAALDLAHLSHVPAMEKGEAIFKREGLMCTGWQNLDDGVDFQGGDEFTARIPFLSIDAVNPEGSWKRHMGRCRLEIRQGIERYDFSWGQTYDALGEDSKYRPESQPWERV